MNTDTGYTMGFEEFLQSAKFVSNLLDYVETGNDIPEAGFIFETLGGFYMYCHTPLDGDYSGNRFWTVLGNQQPIGTFREIARELYDWGFDEEFFYDANYFAR